MLFSGFCYWIWILGKHIVQVIGLITSFVVWLNNTLGSIVIAVLLVQMHFLKLSIQTFYVVLAFSLKLWG